MAGMTTLNSNVGRSGMGATTYISEIFRHCCNLQSFVSAFEGNLGLNLVDSVGHSWLLSSLLVPISSILLGIGHSKAIVAILITFGPCILDSIGHWASVAFCLQFQFGSSFYIEYVFIGLLPIEI